MSEVAFEEDGTGYTVTFGKGPRETHLVTLSGAEYIERFGEALKKGEILVEGLTVIRAQLNDVVMTWVNGKKAELAAVMKPRMKAIYRHRRRQRFQSFRTELATMTQLAVTPGSWFRFKKTYLTPDTEKITRATTLFLSRERGYRITDFSSTVERMLDDIVYEVDNYEYERWRVGEYEEMFESSKLPPSLNMRDLYVGEKARTINHCMHDAVTGTLRALDEIELLNQGLCSLRAAVLLSPKAAFHFPTSFIDQLLAFDAVNKRIAACILGVQAKAKQLVGADLPLPVDVIPLLALPAP
jgi:hypothetical protein